MSKGLKFEKAVVSGDWHGHREYVHKFMRDMKDIGVKEVIHVGDVGFMGDIESYVEYLESLLYRYGMKLYFIEGNHEDYNWLGNLKEDKSTGLKKVSERIKYIPRGHRISYKGKDIVFIGGGVSVDQHKRRKGIDWWEEEELTDKQIEEISNQDPADIMISHDCPKQIDLYLPDSHYFPRDLIKKSEEHREKLGEIYEKLGIKYVVCGHYHIDHEDDKSKVLNCNDWLVREEQYIMLDEVIGKITEGG